MKKILAGTTALVAAAVVSGQAQAADPIKLEIGGFMTQYVGYVDQDAAQNTNENYAEVNTASDTEVYFRGSTTLDNGLKVSAVIDMEADHNVTGTTDDVFMAISSDSLGKIEIGQTKAVAYDMAITAPVGGVGLNDSDLTFFASNNYMGSGTADRLGTLGEDANKVNYYSPNLFGFQVGATYGLAAGGNTADLDTNAAGVDFILAGGLAYSGEFSGVGIAASTTAHKEFAGGAEGAGGENELTVTGGAEISFAGFTVGGGVTKVTDYGQTLSDELESYDVGVSYATGPYTISAGYLEIEENFELAATTDNNVETFVAAVEYDLGAGITASASVFDTDNGNDDRDAFGIVAGVAASF